MTPRSSCLKCGKEVVFNKIEMIPMEDGRMVRTLLSDIHPECGEEFQQTRVTAKELGCEDAVNKLFEEFKK
jgi:hypothetical protein